MGFFSSIGGILGGIGGALLAPVTGGASIAIGAGLGSAAGGAIDSNKANKTAQGYYNQQMSFAQQQAQFQQDYAKNVIQWRMEDAKKAGLHPLAALGVSNPSYSPVSSPSSPEIYNAGDFDTGAEFGQNINRAIYQSKTQAQQIQAADLSLQQIELQNKGLALDNDLKLAQIAQMAADLKRTEMSSVPAPVVNAQNDPQLPSSQSPFMDKPIIRDGWLLDEKGRKISIIPSEALKGRTEDVLGVEWLPFIGSLYRDAKARIIGHEVNGHWWHGLDKGYLPYPPKKAKKASYDYYSNSHRYR